MNKSIILYRYHHKFDQNKEWLKFIRYLNPQVDIYGLFGGPEEQFEEATQFFSEEIKHNYQVIGKSSEWKWRYDDISYHMWFNDFGHQVEFDRVYIIEWDLLFFAPLHILYAHIPPDGLALTGLIPIKKIKSKWFWTNNPVQQEEWLRLMDFFKNNYGYNQKPYALVGPGISYPRAYLERMKSEQIPEISHGEIRVAMYAQALGFPMADTNFFRKWFSKREYRFFNCNNFFISIGTIEKQLKKKNGRRVFHPFRDDITFEQLKSLYQLTLK